jgi:ribose transport system permease protein
MAMLLRYRVAVILCLTLIVAALLVPGFVSLTTLSLGLDRGSTIGLIAIGLTVLLIAGQIDLSVGSVFAVSGIVAIMLQPALGMGWAAVAGALAGAAAGAVNGFLVVVLRINSLVATLATMLVFRSVAHWMTASQPIPGTDIMFSITLSEIYLEVFTVRSCLFLIAILALHVWLTRTVAGRNLFAVGSNAHSAEASGISADRVMVLSFVFASTLAGVAGVLQSLATNTGSPVYGSELTVAVIAAVVVGGDAAGRWARFGARHARRCSHHRGTDDGNGVPVGPRLHAAGRLRADPAPARRSRPNRSQRPAQACRERCPRLIFSNR